jgi:hypothetical protein
MMPAVVGLIYLTFLALVFSYAGGGSLLALSIFVLLAYMALNELWKAKREEDETLHAGTHYDAHGGTH